MACILQPKCNFLHGYFRCRLPVEVVDIEMKITSMQGTSLFRRDRTAQLTKCTPWNSKLYPHPTNNQENENIFRNKREIGSNTPIPQLPVQTLLNQTPTPTLGRPPKL